MGLVGLLHRSDPRNAQFSEIYFLAEGQRNDMGGVIRIYHAHSYLFPQAARTSRTEGLKITDDDTVLRRGNEVLYEGDEPFVIADASDVDLECVFNPSESVVSRRRLLETWAVLGTLRELVGSDEDLSVETKDRIIGEMYRTKKLFGKPISWYASIGDVQALVEERATVLNRSVQDHVRLYGIEPGEFFEEQVVRQIKNGFDEKKEISVIDMLLASLHPHYERLQSLNPAQRPDKLISLVGLRA